MSTRPVRAVTFDFWNTLMWERPGDLVAGRMAALLGLFEERGLALERSVIESAHQVAFSEYQQAWRANRQYTVPDAVRTILGETVGHDDPALHEACVAAFSIAGEATDIQLSEGVEPCLRTLNAAGTRLGIVCDVGLTPSPVLRAHLERRGLLELFDAWAFSDEVGVYKPSRAIFDGILGDLGVEPEAAAHVGDRRRTDVAGAIDSGMVAVRYTAVFDDDSVPEPEGHHVIADMRQLPTVLGIQA